MLILYLAAAMGATACPNGGGGGTRSRIVVLDVEHDVAGGDSDDAGGDITLDGSGRIVVMGGSIDTGWNWDMVIWRYLPTGALDPAFDGDGRVTYGRFDGLLSLNEQGLGVALDSLGRIVVTGFAEVPPLPAEDDLAVWRYNPDGSPDLTLASTGLVTLSDIAGGATSDWGVAVVVDPSDRIIVTGQSINGNGTWDMFVLRLNEDGTLDGSFGTGGVVVEDGTAGGFGEDSGRDLALDPLGRVVVTGLSDTATFDLDMVIWRYDGNGNPDVSFGSGGAVTHHDAAGGAGDDAGLGIAIDPLGRIVVCGPSDSVASLSDMVIWRYNDDGSIDTSFGGSGWVVHANAAGGRGFDVAEDVIVDLSGNIVATGFSERGFFDFDMVVWRYTPDGILETVAVHASAAGARGLDIGWALVEDPGGDIYVTGVSENPQGNSDMVLWRFR